MLLLAERPWGCASSPGSPDGGTGVLVPPCGIAWSCWVLLGALGTAVSHCGRFRGHSFLIPPQSVPSTVLGLLTARQSWEQHRGEGEPAETSKLQRFPFSKCQQIWRRKKQIS